MSVPGKRIGSTIDVNTWCSLPLIVRVSKRASIVSGNSGHFLRPLFEWQQPVPLVAGGLPGVEHAERVEPLVEQGDRVVWRVVDKLFRQHNLVDGAAIYDRLNKLVAC